MTHRKNIIDLIQETLNAEIQRPSASLSEVVQLGDEVLEVIDTDGRIYLIEVTSNTNPISTQGG